MTIPKTKQPEFGSPSIHGRKKHTQPLQCQACGQLARRVSVELGNKIIRNLQHMEGGEVVGGFNPIFRIYLVP